MFYFYSRYESGHRNDYIKFCKEHLGGQRTELTFTTIISPKPLLFLMIEENFTLYLLTATLRSLIGKKTSGLLFRGPQCITGKSLRLKWKSLLLRNLKKLERVNTLSIVPFYLDEKLESICDNWVYDFQFWDREFLESKCNMCEVKEYENKIKSLAKGRKIITAIGKQDRNKGFDSFVSASNLDSEKLFFVSAGKISKECSFLKEGLKSDKFYLDDEFISNSQLLALYRVSDYIWNVYSPQYDQSSGVFGRAIQYNTIPIVRKNSVLEKISLHEGIEYVSCDNVCDDFILALDSGVNKKFGNLINHDKNMKKLFSLL